MTARLSAQQSRAARGAGTTLIALALGVGPVFALMPGASAGPAKPGGSTGSNAKGSLTVHAASGTTILDQRNEPHVCLFRLVADNYDPTKYRGINYTFSRIAPSKPVADGLYPGTISLSVARPNGTIGGQTAVLTIPNGHYKPHGQLIRLNGSIENGQDNFKAFWVTCAASPPPTTPPPTTPPPTTPPPTTAPPTTEATTPPPVETTTPPVVETTAPPVVVTTTEPAEVTTGGTTGGFTGGEGGTVVGTTTGTTSHATTRHAITGGSGAVTTAKTLPFTGSNTGTVTVWGLVSLAAGVGLVVAGSRKPASR